ncbi:MAG: hypothetical protein ABIW82_05305 [Dokdonella sp.]
MRGFSFREQIRDLWMLGLAPACLARLPWPLAYAGCRFLARFAHMFREPTEAAAAIAPNYLPIVDIKAFKRDVRTVWLLDAVDLYLSRRRRTDWLPRHVEVRGAWPRSGAFVALSFHYGHGLWVSRDLRRNGRDSVLVSARFERSAFKRLPVRYRYGVARMGEVERISGEPNAYRPGVRDKLLDALRRGVAVLGVFDMPPRLAPRGQWPVHFLGKPTSLPDGMLALAIDAGVPIVPCWVEVDLVRGRRILVIGEAIAHEPVAQTLAQLADTLNRLIRAQPAAWLFWNELPTWIHDAQSLHDAQASSNPAEEDRVSAADPTANSES